jgi:trk system potassium uptake protein TrkA
MDIAVLGLGRFGSELARSLASLGHEVLAIDLNEGRVQRAAPTCAKAAVADMTDEQALRDLGVAAMDAGIVATGLIEASVLAAMNLQALEVPAVYAKASNPLHASILERIGVRRVVQPEREGGERFAHLIRVEGARDYLSLTADYGIGVYSAPAQLEGKPLRVLDSDDTTRRLLMVVRDGEVELNPVRDRTIAPGDGLVFAGKDEDLARAL